MTIYRFVVRFNQPDPRSAGYLHDACALGFNDLQRITCQDLFFIKGQLSQEECSQLALKLLTDPVSQRDEYSILHKRNERSSRSNIHIFLDSRVQSQ